MPSTTAKYGLEYASSTDSPDLAYITKRLADSTEAALTAAQLTDTGWVDLTPSVTPAAGMTTTLARARIANGILEVLWNGTLTTAISVPANGDTANTTVCTLPAPYRPGSHSRPLVAAAGGPIMGWILTTAGAIQYVSGPPNLSAGVGSAMTCGGSMIL